MGTMTSALVFLSVFILLSGATADLTDRCNAVPINLMFCLKYAVGEADMPANYCCPAARNESAYCLCDLVRFVYKAETLQGYTLKYDRVVNLYSICSIPDGNISLCPDILGLPPGSPDLAAFNSTGTHRPSPRSPPPPRRRRATPPPPPRHRATAVPAPRRRRLWKETTVRLLQEML
ncbi:non-specific lipid transfer protein GPI-anchored 1-like isoform X2 [Wolffia australiana]